MSQIKQATLLSICIPTYNRAKVLNGNLEALLNQVKGLDLPIEIIVSDNCSTDDTESVVNNFISRGLSVYYIKNSVNLGMDGNFAQCYRMAKGKYVLVLGDDDYLIDGMLQKLLFELESGDYGLIHLHPRITSEISKREYTDSILFLDEISFWITYITSNIVNRKYVENYNFEQYYGTYLTIVPLYLNAALKHEKNLMIYDRVFRDGVDINSNGGYNFFQVFLVNYLNIWKQYVKDGMIKRDLFFSIKKDIFKKFLLHNAYNFLILKEKNNYNLEGSWFFLFKNYFYHTYFYLNIFLFIIKLIFKKLYVF